MRLLQKFNMVAVGSRRFEYSTAIRAFTSMSVACTYGKYARWLLVPSRLPIHSRLTKTHGVLIWSARLGRVNHRRRIRVVRPTNAHDKARICSPSQRNKKIYVWILCIIELMRFLSSCKPAELRKIGGKLGDI